MKKTNVLLSLILVVLAGCGDQLDLKPQQAITEDLALSSDSNVKKALLGAYDAFSNGNILGGNLQMFSELLAANNEVLWTGTFNQPREIFTKSISVTNTFVAATWTNSYNAINISNNVLSAIDVVNVDDQDRVKGEALFIRGTTYFELVKIFAKPYSAGNTATNLGVPIILTPTREITPALLVPRSTVDEVYQQAIDDLTEAESLLPSENDVFASKVAAAAVLSRIYLQMENYSDARDAANRAINYGENSLTGSYDEAFNNSSNSSEDIFSFQVTDQDGANNMFLYWSTSDYGARDGDVEVLQDHLDLYEVGDERLNLFFNSNAAMRCGKWRDQFKNLPVIRLAEMYLTRAETNLRLGTSVGAAPDSDINMIRARVGLPDASPYSLNSILNERKLELAFEGQRIHDIKRLKLTIEGYAYDADELIFPIPQREINVNGNLIQNDGYGN
jgi:tetratricopeptide (TPR) repeat protein